MSNADEIARLQKRHDRIVRVAANVPSTALPAVAAAIVEEMKRQAPVLPAATDEREPGWLRDSIVATPPGSLVVIQAADESQPGWLRDKSVVISAGNDQVP